MRMRWVSSFTFSDEQDRLAERPKYKVNVRSFAPEYDWKLRAN
jgi:hypothetical protein